MNVSPGNSGTVKIDSTTPDTYPATQTIAVNQNVNLTAIPNEGYRFTEWTGYSTITSETASITMTCNMSYTANFVPLSYEITTSVSPANSGEIILKPLEPQEGYPFGANVTITAKPSLGFVFKEWSGDNLGVTSNPFVLVVTTDKSITAVFVEKQSSSSGWIVGGTIAGIIVIGLLIYLFIFRKQQSQ